MTIYECKQGMVFTDAYIGSGVEFGSALTNNDGARRNLLTTKRFDTQHLWLGITTISR